ncbi:MAG: formimidoylglutamate deiminase [Betaproteobacteria bacterium]|nr:formimidoylglutamate deiminase [Betaproteobacteria bacterium]
MKFKANLAWINGAWASDVFLESDAQGFWSHIQTNATDADSQGALALGCVIPGLVNAHSHAFQRAIAGLTEHSERSGDDFWSWRDRMYRVALRVSPDHLESIATWLYSEMLRSGYTHVCEFHYLHRNPDGQNYDDAAEMTWALVRAAGKVGMGLTMLPTLYMNQGFGQPGLSSMQRRFASTPESILDIQQSVIQHANENGKQACLTSGVAIHSLRAVDQAEILNLTSLSGSKPIHIHVAEQTKEVADCIAHTGLRPVEWLLAHLKMDERWNLVHATHTNATEIKGIQAQQASVVLCPTTEANLGDGFFDYLEALRQSMRWSIGTDSHVNRNWTEELRLLEYGARLSSRKRNVSLLHQNSLGSTGQVLFENALQGGTQAAGLPLAGIALGQRADLVEINFESDALLGVPAERLIDALIFSTPSTSFDNVFVAGKKVEHKVTQWRTDFLKTMAEL